MCRKRPVSRADQSTQPITAQGSTHFSGQPLFHGGSSSLDTVARSGRKGTGWAANFWAPTTEKKNKEKERAHVFHCQGSDGRGRPAAIPRQALRTSVKSRFWKIWVTFGDKCPQNGSTNAPMAPRTHLGQGSKGLASLGGGGDGGVWPGSYGRFRKDRVPWPPLVEKEQAAWLPWARSPCQRQDIS